jgi:hypothetical protein
MRRVLPIVAVLLALAAILAVVLRDDAPSAAPVGVLRPAAPASETPSFALAPAGADGAPSVASTPEPADLAERRASELPLDVAVLHADGAPAAGCVVVLARDGQPQWHALTDATGVARGSGLDGEVVAWVSGAATRPQQFPLSAPHGRVELELPAGESVAGWVLVDGAPPPAPFVLGLDTQANDSDVPPAIAPLFAPARAAPGAGELHFGQVVGADGAFRFVGRSTPWKCRATLPPGFVAEDDESRDLRAPNAARVLRLRRLPQMRLRVLMPDGAPAAAASVGANVRGGGTSHWNQLQCDAEGRVSIPGLAEAPSEFVNLSLMSAARDARLGVELPIPFCDRDGDLGDVSLEAAWTVSFRALGPDGVPLAGAMGATTCEKDDLRSKLTGADGLGTIAGVPAGCAELLVGAPLHETATVPLPPVLPPGPLDVALAACASLQVHVAVPDGGARPGLRLVFATRTRSSRYVPRGQSLQVMRQLGITPTAHGSYDWPIEGSGDEVGLTFTIPVPADGKVIVGCVEPGEALGLSLVDATCAPLWSREPFVLQPGQQELVSVSLAREPGALEVRVLDAGGRPLADAKVQVSASGPRADKAYPCTPSAITDASGVCCFADLYVEAVDIECSRAGFASTKLTAVAVPGSATATLSEGLTVTVHVVDEAGRPVYVERVAARRTDGVPLRLATSSLDISPDRPGEEDSHAEWSFSNLPAAPVILSARVSGRVVEMEHDARVPEARMVLPATGSLRVRGLPVAVADPGVEVLLLAEGAGGSDLHLSYSPDEGSAPPGECRWPLVLPGTWSVSLKQFGGAGPRVLQGPFVVEVRAGEETLLDLP